MRARGGGGGGRAGVHQIDSNGAYLQAWLWVWWLAAVSAC
jgi:hypothetical protein